MPAQICVHAEFCGKGVAVEHDGSVYACDHYVYPEYRLGNVRERSLGDMVFSPAQVKFGYAKSESLPQYCRNCECLTDCWGECPKNRIVRAPDGEAGLNYLCPGLKRFFATCAAGSGPAGRAGARDACGRASSRLRSRHCARHCCASTRALPSRRSDSLVAAATTWPVGALGPFVPESFDPPQPNLIRKVMKSAIALPVDEGIVHAMTGRWDSMNLRHARPDGPTSTT